jgi:hypothetical protein
MHGAVVSWLASEYEKKMSIQAVNNSFFFQFYSSDTTTATACKMKIAKKYVINFQTPPEKSFSFLLL